MKIAVPALWFALLMSIPSVVWAQHPVQGNSDTFLLVKKKGLIGALAKSFSTAAQEDSIVPKKINPYFIFRGKTIRRIKIVRLGFERDINDTTRYNNNFGTIAANAFHQKTRAAVIANHLFFEEGDKINPYLLADNERYLREQPFIQDALIVINRTLTDPQEVDVTIIVKDVFSLGGGIDMGRTDRIQLELREENLGGSGSRLIVGTLYDGERRPRMGFGADFLKRNIGGSFINWNVGFRTFNGSYSNGRSEETNYYAIFDKPFVSPYMSWLGTFELSLNKSKNNYNSDSLYNDMFRYSYHRVDGWLGYNFGARRLLRKNTPGRVRNILAVRGIYQQFDELPIKALQTFDYRFSNITGLLGSISMFRQNFTRTSFIYGFGRNEDVPEGFRASLIAGWIRKKDSLRQEPRSRPYYAFEGQRSHFNSKGFFSGYTFRIGGYVYRGRWEDVDILLDVDHFTRRKKIGAEWYYRQFYSLGVARQLRTTLNQPLYLKSEFGLPYFSNGDIRADFRGTAKTEAVFYNLRRFWGFRFAPFAFADICIVKPTNLPFGKSDLYAATGAGIRTRNESLVFGTIELKAFYFPRLLPGMKNFRVELSSNIRFRYSNTLIKRPDFITAN